MEKSNFPVEIQIPLAWGEMDAFSHINNVHFFRYFEGARIEYFRRIALGAVADTIGPILAETSCKFIKSLVFPDTITVGASVTRLGNSSMEMVYQIHSPKLGLCAMGKGAIVWFNYKEKKSTPIPADVRARVEELQGMSFRNDS